MLSVTVAIARNLAVPPNVAFKESNKLRFEVLQNVFSNKKKKNQAYQNAAINNLSFPGRIEG